VTLSGYQNPSRGELRAAALSMGARYEADFGASVTHVCSAFESTPKTKQARESGGIAIVRGEWLRDCQRAGRRLPEQDFLFSSSATSQTVAPAPAAQGAPAAQAAAGSPTSSQPHAQGDSNSPARKRPRAASPDASSARDVGVAVKKEPTHKAADAHKPQSGGFDGARGANGGSANNVATPPKDSGGGRGGSHSPSVLISKVTRVDDPVASFDLTGDGGDDGAGVSAASGNGSSAGGSTGDGGGSGLGRMQKGNAHGGSHKDAVKASLSADIDRFKAWLRQEHGDEVRSVLFVFFLSRKKDRVCNPCVHMCTSD
jgi:hypothetical protein